MRNDLRFRRTSIDGWGFVFSSSDLNFRPHCWIWKKNWWREQEKEQLQRRREEEVGFFLFFLFFVLNKEQVSETAVRSLLVKAFQRSHFHFYSVRLSILKGTQTLALTGCHRMIIDLHTFLHWLYWSRTYSDRSGTCANRSQFKCCWQKKKPTLCFCCHFTTGDTAVLFLYFWLMKDGRQHEKIRPRGIRWRRDGRRPCQWLGRRPIRPPPTSQHQQQQQATREPSTELPSILRNRSITTIAFVSERNKQKDGSLNFVRLVLPGVLCGGRFLNKKKRQRWPRAALRQPPRSKYNKRRLLILRWRRRRRRRRH